MMRAGLAILMLWSLSGCTTDPPSRLGAYLGRALVAEEADAGAPGARPGGPVAAGLVVINDTTAPDSAPPISEEVLDELVRVLRNRLNREIPTITVESVTRPVGLAPDGDPASFAAIAREQGLEYILLAIFSSNEMESPAYLPLTGTIDGGGGGRSVRPGYEVQNFARVELALLDGQTGHPLVQGNGQSYATLFRLDISLETNTYPVVRRNRLSYPIYPQESNAYDILRGVAADDAIKQALMHFKLAWDRQVPS